VFCRNCGKELLGSPEICPNCGASPMRGNSFCSNCGASTTPLTEMCVKCGVRVATGQEVKVTYNTALRVISGILGFLCILSVTQGLTYFAESGLVSELAVDIVTIIIAIAYFLMAFSPQWVRAKLGIRLERGSVFGLAVVVLLIVSIVAVALGPEPPGGWWSYGEL